MSQIKKKCRKNAFLGCPARLLRYYIGGFVEIYNNITWGGGFPIYLLMTYGAVSSRSFYLLNSMIYDLKTSADPRWLFDPVLHSSLDDLVLRICQLSEISWNEFTYKDIIHLYWHPKLFFFTFTMLGKYLTIMSRFWNVCA